MVEFWDELILLVWEVSLDRIFVIVRIRMFLRFYLIIYLKDICWGEEIDFTMYVVR